MCRENFIGGSTELKNFKLILLIRNGSSQFEKIIVSFGNVQMICILE